MPLKYKWAEFLIYLNSAIYNASPTAQRWVKYQTSYNVIIFRTASKLGVKELLPPFLSDDLGLNDLLTGVAFASGGSGYDPLTSKLAVIFFFCKSNSYTDVEVFN